MLQELMRRMRQAEYRRLFATLVAGKVLGAAAVVGAIVAFNWYFSTPAYADTPAEPPAFVNPINTMWTVIAAFLVFFMQAGFMMLEAGFSRTRETVNILLEGIVDTCLCGILFWAWGFAFMFGAGNGFIGKQ